MLPIEQNENDSRRDNKRDILSSDLHSHPEANLVNAYKL